MKFDDYPWWFKANVKAYLGWGCTFNEAMDRALDDLDEERKRKALNRRIWNEADKKAKEEEKRGRILTYGEFLKEYR